MAQISPTKSNLLSLKHSLELAKTGYDLLDRKKNILLRETLEYAQKAKEIEQQVFDAYSDSFKAIRMANMQLGLVDNIAKTTPIDKSLTVEYKSIMGVDVPKINYVPSTPVNTYGYFDTTVDLDIAYEKFLKVKELTFYLAEIETAVYRLAEGIKKSATRSNALKNIVIPRMEAQIKEISSVLEEKEREEFTRLKVIKKKIS